MHHGESQSLGTGGGPGSDNRIGGTASGAGNVIAGYTGGGAAIFIGGTSSGDSRRANSNIVQGNFIGTNRDGSIVPGNLGTGVHVQDGDNNLIGGTVPGAPNIIVRSMSAGGGNGAGVLVNAGTGNRILGNTIYESGRLGIEFAGGTPVTLNDAGDPDTGPNNLQNYPLITAVTISTGSATITGTLNSTPATTFRLEFFSNPSADETGYGEGQTFLGFTDATTDAAGNASYSVTFPVAVDAKSFVATATDAAGNTSEFSPAFRGRLLNISSRMRVLTDERVLIGGFIITGADSKKVIIRGLGPSLSASGVSGVLPDPTLELRSSSVTMTNDNWKEAQQAEIEATGVPPTSDAEAAIVATLAPGAYTALVAGKDNTTGVGLVEVYDLNQSAGSKLANISTRGFVDTGGNVMIGGFIIGPSDLGSIRVVVRAIGPSLTAQGVPGALADPTLELFDGNGVTIATNDNWKESQQTEIEATSIPPTNDLESTVVATLGAGNYTAVVRGKDDTTGVGLVEVYNVQ